MVVMKVGCCGKVVAERCCGFEGGNLPQMIYDCKGCWTVLEDVGSWDPGLHGMSHATGELKPQHLSATTHLHNNHMYGAVNIRAFIKYYIGAFNIQLTEYNHNL